MLFNLKKYNINIKKTNSKIDKMLVDRMNINDLLNTKSMLCKYGYQSFMIASLCKYARGN